MPPTRQEYIDLVAHKESVTKPYVPSIDTALGMIRTAAVSFEHLTNDEHWDRFLSYAQAKLDGLKEERETAKFEAVTGISDQAIRSAQHHFHAANGAIIVLEELMALPAQFKQGYDALRKT